MSHNVTIEGVKFTDLDCLRRAVSELSSELGINTSFVVGKPKVTVRGWRGAAGEGVRYSNSAWNNELNHECDAAILFPNEKYDIGLNWDDAQKGYVPFIESSWRTPFASDRNAIAIDGSACTAPTTHALPGMSGKQGVIGKLQQRYAMVLAEQNAARQGMMTRRVVGKGGQLQLYVTHK